MFNVTCSKIFSSYLEKKAADKETIEDNLRHIVFHHMTSQVLSL